MNEKGFNIKIYGLDYFLIFKEEGLYFKRKNNPSEDLYIPFEEINYWDGLCLRDNFFFKFKFSLLLKIYAVLGFLFLLLFPKNNIIIIGLYIFFFLIVIGMIYMKTNYVTIIADFERIPLKLGDNRKVCYLMKVLKEKCKKLSLKQKLFFEAIRQVNNLKENLKTKETKDRR